MGSAVVFGGGDGWGSGRILRLLFEIEQVGKLEFREGKFKITASSVESVCVSLRPLYGGAKVLVLYSIEDVVHVYELLLKCF